MSESKQQVKKRKESLESTPKNAIKSNTTIAALAMKGATPFQKIIVYCCYGVILLGIIILSTPPYQSLKELIAFGVSIVFLGMVVFSVLKRYKDLTKEQPTTSTEQRPTIPICWHPLPTLKCQSLITVLEETRKLAFEFLKQKDSKLLDDNVRANIFYPEYYSPANLQQYKLKIYPGLHLKMDYPPELNISFLPNQGATGNVFASGQARVAQRLPSGTEGWDGFYNITNELAATIHPDLKWVISMPLQVAGGKPMGVMNVDGLRCQIPNDTLYKCIFRLTTNVVVMSNVLAAN